MDKYLLYKITGYVCVRADSAGDIAEVIDSINGYGTSVIDNVIVIESDGFPNITDDRIESVSNVKK